MRNQVIVAKAAQTFLESTWLGTLRTLPGLPSSVSCVFYLRKGKAVGSSQQIFMRWSRCPNLLTAFSFQSAATESTISPCTAIPVVCRLCCSTSSAGLNYTGSLQIEPPYFKLLLGFFHRIRIWAEGTFNCLGQMIYKEKKEESSLAKISTDHLWSP